MKDREWLALDDETLEGLLVERWLFRGLMLAVMLIAAITITYLGMDGVNTLMDQLTVGVLLVMAFSAGAAVFVMRLTDIRMHRELKRRRGREGRSCSPNSPLSGNRETHRDP
ncbi:hypothetical protein EPO44_11130 [bacterium]|nr:MAG: hypothetical protein EPO44_11130 [bacterium]